MTNNDRPIRLLVIEDDLDLCDGWKDLFNLLGFEYRFHHRGHSALADLESIHDCDVVISDYYLPDLNGVELVKKIRGLRQDIPVIFLSGSKEPGVVSAVQSLPDCVLLHKPISIDILERTILETCDRVC